MQADLVRVCLSSEVFNLRQAVQASDRALSSISKAVANYEKLIEVWNKHRQDSRVLKTLLRKQPNPPPPDTSVLLHLFWEPKFSSRQLSRRCMDLFGPQIVEAAVSNAVDDPKERFDILLSFDPAAFKHLRPLPTFKRGDRVILSDLQTASHLNGKKGQVLKWHQDNGRYEVKIDGRKKTIAILPSNIKLDDTYDNKKQMQQHHTFPTQPKTNSQSLHAGSSDDDSDEPPALNSREQSSSESSSSSSDDSVPPLQERGNRSESSDDDSSSSGVPDLTKKNNSSSDEEGIPDLIGPNQQSSSSSDESAPQRRTRGTGAARGNPGRGDDKSKGRGGNRGRRRRK